MQTFFPYKDYDMSAQALDNKRLNKQVLECYQILKVLSNPDPRAGWRNHPAVKMWRNHEVELWNYTMAMVYEATDRGIKTDKNLENLTALHKAEGMYWGFDEPAWFNDSVKMARINATHKANLYKKDPQYYFEFYSALSDGDNQPCCPDRKEPCKYYWVTHEGNND